MPNGYKGSDNPENVENMLARARVAAAMACVGVPPEQSFIRAYKTLQALRGLPNQTPTDGRWRLCHAVAIGTRSADGQHFGHAWLENRKLVFDTMQGAHYEAAEYYNAGRITRGKIYRYSPRRARELAVSSMSFGPWEKELEGKGVLYAEPQAYVPAHDPEPDLDCF